MKIYIVTDLEGVSGIGEKELIAYDSPGYPTAVAHLLEDISAAVEGAFAGGATEVVVRDGHGSGQNFTADQLNPKARRAEPPFPRYMGTMDESFSGLFFVGAHAMAGTQHAFYDHTQSSVTWLNYYVNGVRCGEMAQAAIAASQFGVAPLLVTGDEAACAEGRQFFSGIATCAVKAGLSHTRARCYDLDACRKGIYEAAKLAMSLVGKVRPYKPLLPMELKLELMRADYCDDMATLPGVERLDARTIRRFSNTYSEVLFR